MSFANLNDMQLEDLDDQSLIPRQRRRRARVIADEKTMLPKPSKMINEKGLDKVAKLHTKVQFKIRILYFAILYNLWYRDNLSRFWNDLKKIILL